MQSLTHGGILSYHKFMALKTAKTESDTDDLLFLPPASIGKIWETHILHSRNYAEYCDKICGKFIHHNPDGVKARQQSSLSRTTLSRDESVLNAMNAYKDFFGEACQWDYKGFEAITTNCRDANRAFKQYDFFFKTTKITEMKRIFETYRLRQCPARDISTLISFGRSNNQGRGHSVDSEIEGSGKN